MTQAAPIIELHPWLALPPGQALLDWEQAQMDRLVADLFGFHALQLGLPELDALRANRMPHRWMALDASYAGWAPAPGMMGQESGEVPLGLRCEFEALPFPSQSLDLVVLPHALELAHDPHDTLREVERVLMPEGRVVIAGFNPASLWGLRQRMSHLGLAHQGVLPQGDFIAYWRLRDWLRLLDLEVESGFFGCYRPMVSRARTWDRLQWMEHAGDRWWPVFGAVYFVVAVKRTRAMRLVGKVRHRRAQTSPKAAVVTQRGHFSPSADAARAQQRIR
ncbi:methyltransferase domain-containing protein [Aquabacterium sp. A3]|uniref:class I SAM-dependent methyltransferase n=1 Tax=Aquabacterium sp. A3 TaxID=3132829 RepID=UPI003119BC01